MKHRRHRIALVGLGTVAVALAAAPRLYAKGGFDDVRFYNGQSPAQTGMTLMSWGSGEARESEEHIFTGSRSIKITTQGRYQGARLVYRTPLDIKSNLTDKTAYLEFTYTLGTESSGGTGRFGPPGFGPGAPGAPYGRSGGPPGGELGPGGRGGGSGTAQAKAMQNLRVVLVTSDDKRFEVNLPLDSARKTNEEWMQIAVPLAAIKGLGSSSGAIKELQIFGDATGALYLGEARIVHDETPIHVDDLEDRTVAVNDTVTFVASAEAGPTPLKYQWDFDSADGVQVDAEGRVVRHQFRKSRKGPDGDTIPYVVTLKVSDLYGLKPPVTTTCKVSVTL